MWGFTKKQSTPDFSPATWEPPVSGVAMTHQMLRDQMARRRGGSIGVGNKGAIALRFDHGLNNFRDLVLPLLQKYDLPASQAYPTRMFTGETSAPDESDTSSWDEVRQWARATGIEPLAHSRTHLPADTPDALHDEIILAREELAAAIPESAIETWAVPGGGGTEYMGFDDGKAPDRFYNTLAGAMILSTYGFSTGYLPGPEVLLQGRAPIGMTHSTVDRATALLAARGKVRQIVENRTGYVVMLHPKYLTYSKGKGYSSADDLDAFLAFVSGLRDSGKLEVMTVGGLAHAFSGSRERLNLITGGLFPENWETRFTGTDRWSRVVDATARIPRSVGRGEPGGMLSQSIPSWRIAPHRGAVFEVIANVRALDGATAVIGSPSIPGGISDHELPAANRWRTVRQYVTIPLNEREPLTVTVGSRNGTIDVLDWRLQPI